MRKAVLLDRDGTINRMIYDVEHGTIDSPSNLSQFGLLPKVAKAIRLINEMKMLVIVVSNQPGIAKGKFTTKILSAMDQKMQAELEKQGAHLDGIYYCLHHPEAVVKGYRKNCDCRKPEPGLLLKGRDDFQIDLSCSYTIGDGLIDIQAGKAAGCKTIFLGQLKCSLCKLMDRKGVKPDYIVSDLLEAAKLIKKLEAKNANFC